MNDIFFWGGEPLMSTAQIHLVRHFNKLGIAKKLVEY